MSACIKVPTLQKLLLVEDSDLPQVLFAMECDEQKHRIYKYVRFDSLPEEVRNLIMNALGG